MPRKINPESQYNMQKQRVAETTEFFNDKKPWTNEDMDDLLEAFLVEDLSFYDPTGKLKTYASKCGRFVKSIERRLWSLATRDDGHGGFLDYLPKSRTFRDGPFTHNDYWIIDKSLSRDRFDHLPQTLSRSQLQIEALWQLAIREEGEGLIESGEIGMFEKIDLFRKYVKRQLKCLKN